MARVSFTVNLQRHVACESLWARGTTVAEVLRATFAHYPRLRGYVVDEHGALRKHMNIFVDGEQIQDRSGLSDSVGESAEIYIMQALSGG